MQPSELAKIVVILFMAALLERRMDRIDEPTYALLPIGVVARRGRRADPASSRISARPSSILMIAAVMVFAAGISYRYVVGLASWRLPALYLLVMVSGVSRAAGRWRSWIRGPIRSATAIR